MISDALYAQMFYWANKQAVKFNCENLLIMNEIEHG
jgi:hypothetical protein